jgi:hypothetical protein
MLVLLPLVYRYVLKGKPPHDFLFAAGGIVLGMGACVCACVRLCSFCVVSGFGCFFVFFLWGGGLGGYSLEGAHGIVFISISSPPSLSSRPM